MTNYYNKQSYQSSQSSQSSSLTYQSSLTKEDIKKKLEDYKEINDINKIPIGTHIRYFINNKKSNTPLFRLGGTLAVIDPSNRFIKLTNGAISWSVQLIQCSKLYQKMSDDEIKEELKEELKKEILSETFSQVGGSNDMFIKLENENKILKTKLKKYTNLEIDYNNLIKKNESLNNKLNKIENEIIKKKEIKT